MTGNQPSSGTADSTGSSSVVTGVHGRGVPVRGDDIDTDRIIPARYLRCLTFDGLGEHAFEDDRKNHPGGPHPFDREEFRLASILVVNRNFGCGSSREHAPQSLLRRGIRAMVGESFAEIFFGNCIALGIPCLTLDAGEIAALQQAIEREPAVEISVDVKGRSVVHGDLQFAAGLTDGARQAFLAGTWDSAGVLMECSEDVARLADSLPYVSAWRTARKSS